MTQYERYRLAKKLRRVRLGLQSDLNRLRKDFRAQPADQLAMACDRLQATIEALVADIGHWS